MPYTVGHNMPGYMPESDPYTFADYESARTALVDDVERLADQINMGEDDATARDGLQECELAIAWIKNATEGELSYLISAANLVYWITWTNWSEVDWTTEDYGNREDLAEAFLAWCEETQTDALSTFDIPDDLWRQIRRFAGETD